MSETVLDALAFLQWLIDENGYRDPKPIPGGRYAGIRPMIFTYAIVSGQIGDRWGVDRHWCYHSYDEAKAALDAWDGLGEPTGWHRDPVTGRRVSQTGDELDGDGDRIGVVGKVYVRP